MNLKDLVVLKYASNSTHTKVVNAKDVKEEDFKIDLENKTWSYKQWEDMKIGQSRNMWDNYSNRCKWGIIGVYNKRITTQLNSMIHSAKEFTEKRIYSVAND